MAGINPQERRLLIGAAALSLCAGVLSYTRWGGAVTTFVIAAVALALLASLVGAATEQVGSRMSAGATGVLQSALGNLPELFIALFSLKAGLVTVVQSALVGSILGNNLLVLGLAFWVGGLKHGTQRFNSEAPKMISALMLLAVSALAVPTLAAHLHTAAGHHVQALSVACAVVLLLVFAASIPVSLRGSSPSCPDSGCPVEPQGEGAEHWPLWLAVLVLAGSGVAAAFVSDWFVEALRPAIHILHLSEAFTGLVVVAIAGNAVENVVGIQLMRKNQPDYAVSVILNSPLQVALGLWPLLVLVSAWLPGLSNLTLVLPPLLVAALVLSSLVSAIVAFDGESIWLEGVSLVALYVIIAAAFWWG